MSGVRTKAKNIKVVIANLHRYGDRTQERGRAAMAASLERTYGMAQSLCAVETGETKSKMRKVVTRDGLGYQMGFFASDFAGPFIPLFLEYGTKRAAAHPCIHPTAEAERNRVKQDLAEAMRP